MIDLTALAESAYNAYGDHARWTAYDGGPMPPWENLSHSIKGHWEAVAIELSGRVARHVRARETRGEQ